MTSFEESLKGTKKEDRVNKFGQGEVTTFVS